MEFILPQYEQARIQEAKDAPSVQIIDPPNIPELKSRPKRAVVILLTVFIVGAMAAVIIILYERILILEKEQPEIFVKIVHIFEAFKYDLRFKKN